MLKYVPGKTYEYRFSSKAVTELVGTSDEESRVELRGTAHLAVTPDDFVLTLKNVKLQAPIKQVPKNVFSLSRLKSFHFFSDAHLRGKIGKS